MMEILIQYIVQHAVDLLLACNALVAAAAAFAISRFQRTLRRNDAFWRSPTGAALAAPPSADSDLLGFLDHRLRIMQTRIETLATNRPANTVPVSTPPSADKNGLPFDYAVRMARQGAGIEELVRGCGLSRAEAKLIHRVHGRPAATDAAAA